MKTTRADWADGVDWAGVANIPTSISGVGAGVVKLQSEMTALMARVAALEAAGSHSGGGAGGSSGGGSGGAGSGSLNPELLFPFYPFKTYFIPDFWPTGIRPLETVTYLSSTSDSPDNSPAIVVAPFPLDLDLAIVTVELIPTHVIRVRVTNLDIINLNIPSGGWKIFTFKRGI
jgi:hypothetical protein